MADRESYGDIRSIRCPNCKEPMDLSDHHRDRLLEPGIQITCDECDAVLIMRMVSPIVVARLEFTGQFDR